MFAKLQRRFRLRHQISNKAAYRIQAYFHLRVAKRKFGGAKTEVYAVRTLQRAWRCYRAMQLLLNHRCVTNKQCSVLKVSSALNLHGPEKLLDFKSHTFWMSESAKHAEVSFLFDALTY